jgi:hypothetical protein
MEAPQNDFVPRSGHEAKQAYVPKTGEYSEGKIKKMRGQGQGWKRGAPVHILRPR